MWALLAIGFFNSIMFPNDFLLWQPVGCRSVSQSPVLCTAIVGGAFVPLAHGWVADTYNFASFFRCISDLLCIHRLLRLKALLTRIIHSDRPSETLLDFRRPFLLCGIMI